MSRITKEEIRSHARTAGKAVGCEWTATRHQAGWRIEESAGGSAIEIVISNMPASEMSEWLDGVVYGVHRYRKLARKRKGQ